MMRAMICCSLSVVSIPASAQDVPSPYESSITDHAQLQLDSTLAKRRLEQARRARRGTPPARIGPNARAICLDKKRVASRLSSAKARQLYALCAQAGL